MKILIASFTFPPNKDGVSEAASMVAQAYLAQGWQVEVLTMALPEARGALSWNGATIHEYKMAKGGELRLSGSDQAKVEDFLRKGDWDLVIIQAYEHLLRLFLALPGQVSGKKVLVSHGFPGLVRYPVREFPWGIPSMLRRFYRAWKMLRWIHCFDRVVYLSPKTDLKGFYDQFLARLAGYRGRIHIPNGIDPELRSSAGGEFRERYGIPYDAIVFLCVANYSPRKDQGYAARAFRRAAIPNSRLVFIGSAFNEHSEKFMRQDRESASPDRFSDIVWLEKIDRQATLDAFAACDVFLLSALHEAQPISLLEAMRENKPWIARKSGCIDQMEGGITTTSETEMCRAMARLASHPELRMQLAKQGRTAVEEKYSLDQYRKSYVQIAKELVQPS